MPTQTIAGGGDDAEDAAASEAPSLEDEAIVGRLGEW